MNFFLGACTRLLVPVGSPHTNSPPLSTSEEAPIFLSAHNVPEVNPKSTPIPGEKLFFQKQILWKTNYPQLVFYAQPCFAHLAQYIPSPLMTKLK